MGYFSHSVKLKHCVKDIMILAEDIGIAIEYLF